MLKHYCNHNYWGEISVLLTLNLFSGRVQRESIVQYFDSHLYVEGKKVLEVGKLLFSESSVKE